MATTKKAPAKATGTTRKTKAAPAPEPEAEPSGREQRAAKNGQLQVEVVKMREDGAKWGEIAEALDITPGKAMFLEMKAQVADNPKLAIKWSSDEDLAAKVTAARNEDMLSWGQISARTGVSEGKLKKLWETGGGEKGHRIGKGGRFPAGADRPAKATKQTTKKAGAGTGSSQSAKTKTLKELNTLEDFQAKLDGAKAVLTRNGKEVVIAVRNVKDIDAKGTITVLDQDGKSRSFKKSELTGVRRPAR